MLFWNLYALFYNKLNELIPYQEHVSKVLDALQISDNKLYVDLGCGSGNLIRNKKNIVGVDVSVSMLELAKKRNPETEFVVANLNEKLPFGDNAFDGGYTSNVVAYLESPEKFFLEVYRILKPNSEFVVATLRSQFSPSKILQAHLKKASFWNLFINIPFIFLILVLNIPITTKLKKNVYHGFEIENLKQLVLKCGFEVISAGYTYANQDVLLLLRRN